jgi:hypothetical protein
VGMLPNFTRVLASMSWFSDSPASKRHPIAHLFRKAMIVICAVRNCGSIMKDYSENADGIMEILNLCLLVSSLRMYPHADECPTMTSAIELWHRFTVDTRDAAYADWCNTHDTLVWFALREYQLFLVKNVDALYYTLTRSTNLPAVDRSVSNGLDHACRIFNRFGKYQDDSVNLDTCKALHMYYYTQEQLPWALKMSRDSFLNMLRKVLVSMFERIYLINEPYCYASTVSEKMRNDMHQYVSRLDPFEYSILQQRHMEHWGIDPALVGALFECKKKFEIDGEADNRTKKELEIMLITKPSNFHAIHMIITFMWNHCKIELIPLNSQVAESQEHALRTRYQVPPYRTLTTAQITDYFCPVCMRVCAPLTPPCWTPCRSDEGFTSFAAVEQPKNIGYENVKWNTTNPTGSRRARRTISRRTRTSD